MTRKTVKDISILAIIPARGGSKGILKKNIRDLGGKPLLVWTIEAALGVPYINQLIVSTDSQEIADISSNAGCKVPFLRNPEFAQDNSKSIDLVREVYERINESFKYILLLQPTSPFRNSKHITECIDLLIAHGHNSVVSFTEVKEHPSTFFSIANSGFVKSFTGDYEIRRRQEFNKYYKPNGAIYLNEAAYLLSSGLFIREQTVPYLMDRYSSIDIDDEMDLEYANFLIEKDNFRKE